jgi:short-subunit dehydrogenase/acyl carrier protein
MAAPWLILADRSGLGQLLAERLQRNGERTVTFFHDEDFTAACSMTLKGVIYLWALDADPIHPADLDVNQSSVCGGLLRLLQSDADIQRLWIVTRGTQGIHESREDNTFNSSGGPKSIAIEQAPLWGFANALAVERPDLHCCRIDLDPEGGPQDNEVLFAALESEVREDRIAIRGGRQYVPRMIRFGTNTAKRKSVRIDDKGTYMLTGGLGALGMQTARWLVQNGARHVVLVGRNVPSDAAEVALRKVSDQQVDVRCVSADVAHPVNVERVLQKIETAMPPLKGIIHAAGIIDDGLLAQQSWERFGGVMAPKIQGAWNLHQATKSMNLDFFVMFSSLASFLGSASQTSYAAANAFLDALAHRRRLLGLHGLSVNWGSWADGGMSARLSDHAERRLASIGLLAMPPDIALKALDQALQSDATQVAILNSDWRRLREHYSEQQGPPLLRELLRDDCPAAVLRHSILEKLVGASPVEQRFIVREHVRGVVARVLGLDRSNRLAGDQKFFEFGMDSLMALELKNQLQQDFGLMPSTIAIEYPTVDALSEYLTASLDIVTAPTTSPWQSDDKDREFVDKLEELSEDEAAALLNSKLEAMYRKLE